jgi:nucleoside permease NupC
MHIYRSGVFVTYPFFGKIKLLQPRISLLISLILVGFDSITDIRILYDIIKALHNTRRILIKGCFKDIDNNKSFAKSI